MASSAIITRRSALVGALSSIFMPPAALALVQPAIADEEAMSPQERADFHLAEYKAAMAECDPMIVGWDSHELGGKLVLTANRISGRYVGDGFYECWHPKRTNKVINSVILMPELIDGHRTFAVRPWPGIGPATRYIEPVLEQYICHLMT